VGAVFRESNRTWATVFPVRAQVDFDNAGEQEPHRTHLAVNRIMRDSKRARAPTRYEKGRWQRGGERLPTSERSRFCYSLVGWFSSFSKLNFSSVGILRSLKSAFIV